MADQNQRDHKWFMETLWAAAIAPTKDEFQYQMAAIHAYNEAQNLKLCTEREIFQRSIALLERGMELEKAGDYDKALYFYFENIQRYATPGLLHFERPAILLEKLKRYEEAIAICKSALCMDVTHQPTKIAFKNKFQHRLERLQRKLAKSN